MTFDEVGAKAVVAALLDEAGGQVGRFVPVTDVIASSGMDASRATAALDEFAERRWVQIRSDRIAATRWGLEFAMDWTFVGPVLRVLDAGGAESGDVAAASGLSVQEVDKLLNALAVLGFASQNIDRKEGRPPIFWASITGKGREYLTNGCKVPELSRVQENDASIPPDVWP